jgi:hypothetical protein
MVYEQQYTAWLYSKGLIKYSDMLLDYLEDPNYYEMFLEETGLDDFK